MPPCKRMPWLVIPGTDSESREDVKHLIRSGDVQAVKSLLHSHVSLPRFDYMSLGHGSVSASDFLWSMMIEAVDLCHAGDASPIRPGLCEVPVRDFLRMVQLLSFYGGREAPFDWAEDDSLLKEMARRSVGLYSDGGQSSLRSDARFAKRANVVLQWLRESHDWCTPLHYAVALYPDLLCVAGVKRLLTGGADLAACLEFGHRAWRTPLQLARLQPASNLAAAMVVRASLPWSPSNHDLFPSAAQCWAHVLLRLLYRVRWDRMSNGGLEAADFSHLVMRFAVHRSSVSRQRAWVERACVLLPVCTHIRVAQQVQREAVKNDEIINRDGFDELLELQVQRGLSKERLDELHDALGL